MNLHSTLTTISISIFTILILPSLFSLHFHPTIVTASSRILPELHTTEALTVQTHPSPVKCKPHQAPVYKQLCNKTRTVTLCESVIKSDKRKNLKSTPEGLVVILVDAAKRNVITTTNFINVHLKNTTDEDTVQGLKNCQVGYRTILPTQLDITVQELRDDPERRKKFYEVLRDTMDEVFYDCQWFQPDPYPQLLKIMVAKQTIFDQLLDMARTMIDLIK